jgi:hypothetical protein
VNVCLQTNLVYCCGRVAVTHQVFQYVVYQDTSQGFRSDSPGGQSQYIIVSSTRSFNTNFQELKPVFQPLFCLL